jgi:hypothetical protein
MTQELINTYSRIADIARWAWVGIASVTPEELAFLLILFVSAVLLYGLAAFVAARDIDKAIKQGKQHAGEEE